MKPTIFDAYAEPVKTILTGLYELYDEETDGIVLYGSTATNTLVYRQCADGRYEFSSDIEFLLIPRNRENACQKSYRTRMMQWSTEYLKTLPFLSIAPFVDVYPVTEAYFSALAPRISTFELKQTGKVLKGKDYLREIPEVNAATYSPQVQNIELVKGLKLLFLESNSFFLHRDLHTKEETDRFCYFLSSSFLNLLRTLLPLFGHFEPLLSERVKALSKLKNDPLFNQYFSSHTTEQFAEIAKSKAESSFSMEPKTLFLQTYSGYKNLFCLLTKCDEDLLSTQIEEQKDSLFAGPVWKVKQLSDLTRFFLSGLDCMCGLLSDGSVSSNAIEKAERNFDELLAGQNAYRLLSLMDKYAALERERWKIIGSKD